MTLTKQLETEILKVYHEMWDANLRGDINTFASHLDDQILIFGTAEGEILHSREEAEQYYSATADQMTGKAKFQKRQQTLRSIGEAALLNEECDLYVLADDSWIFYSHVRISALFIQRGTEWRLVHMHGSFPDSRTEAGEQIATEKIKAENDLLRQAVQRRTVELEDKNRELQIEAALERVRTVAMGIKAPEDMLQICMTISQRLETLGLAHIRNVQTAIFYPNRGTYMNYEYYARYEKTFLTEVDYRNHPIQQAFATKMMQGAGEELQEQLTGQKMRDWYDYQQTTNQFADDYILQAESLNYYWFSLGPVALGISTYAALSPQEIDLFKRFLKVFELAYQRYLDIEKALSQAKEAQTELALERIRAQVTAMMAAKDLLDIVVSMRKEFVSLGHEAHYFWYMRWLPEKYEKAMTSGDGTKIGMVMTLPRHIHGDIPLVADWETSDAPALVYPMDVNASIAYVHKMVELGNFIQVDPQAPSEDDLRHINGLTFVMARTTHGEIGYSLPGVVANPPGEDIATLVRFAGVFDLAYRRFEDLQEAEKRNRETQIELSLERVRARSMAMYESRELGSVAAVMFDQMRMLGGELFAFGIVLCDPQKNTVEQWHGLAEGDMMTPFEVPIDLDYIHRYRYDQWKSGVALFSIEIPSDYIAQHFDLMFALPSVRTVLDDLSAKGINVAAPSWEIDYGASFKHGYLLISSLKPFAESHVFPRFAKVFEQAYTRFLDLQKAEAQAREAEIELALERVRARTMAMQHSEELAEASAVLDQQVRALGIETWGCAFHIYANDPEGDHEWFSGREGNLPFYKTPRESFFLDFYEKGKAGETFHLQEFLGDDCKKHYDYLMTLPTVGDSLRNILQSGGSLPESQFDHIAFFKYGYVLFITYEPAPDAVEIFKRFAKVFDQTYTRFLDLQKAEAQAREAQIEAALERVRSRSMAMQKSHELKDVIQVVYDQMAQLKLPVEHTGFILDYKTRSDYPSWIADHLGSPSHIVIPYFEAAYYDRFNQAKREGEAFFTVNLDFDEKNMFYQDLFKHLPGFPEDSKAFILQQPALTLSTVLLEDVALYIENFSGLPFSDQENSILMRFGKVFQQTYTRFLDLQKAETLAREAQIEAALERVRSKTMAMHNSQEVGESVATLFDELQFLGVLGAGDRCGIGIMQPQYTMEAWTAAKTEQGKAELTIGMLNMTLHPLLISAYEGWANKKELNQYILEGNDRTQYYDTFQSQLDYKLKRDYNAESDRTVHSDFYFKEGCLYVFSQQDLTPETVGVYKRFAAVFGQTYRRYQDLLKAEAQAREAQIEAALESIRSKAMAMRTSEDIAETTAASFAELKKLGISSFRSGVGILTKGSRMAQVFADTRTEDGQTTALTTLRSMDEHPALQQQYSAWEKQEDYEQFLSGDELITYYSHSFFKNSNINLEKKKENHQECGYYFAFPDGLFYSWSHQPYTEAEKNILRRFRNIVSLTFRRYLDLQNAEAQAREATKQASLDRVRAIIASMRSTEDLELITPLIFKELTILGVPFIRCGVFIMHEDRQVIDAYLSSPSGTSLGVLHLPFTSSDVTLQSVDAWRKGQVYRQHWSQADFIAWTRQMMDQHQIESSRTYQGADTAPESLDLHFVPFDQGMLYVGSLQALGEQDVELVLALAKSFSIAYARYEDFVKLEAAKANIESTLTELKSTQAQLIQQEKLASLGQLTAGIAHEIQNPLNFVNNFSEINAELSEEILEAAEKGDIDEVKALAIDIKSNQEKIKEHGKRADSIVKGMLQHSRSSAGAKEPTDIAALADEYLRLAYHGMRAKDKSFNASLKTEFDPGLPMVPAVAQDIGRVLLNLFNNAFYAVNERKKTAGDGYEPEVVVQCGWANSNTAINHPPTAILISVSDNGSGIPEAIKAKIFQPFFTTKPTGQGTGLGLSLSYDIIKAHGGSMIAESTEGIGSHFFLTIPSQVNA